MTAHKHFKQLARARMAEMGESYTAARRQLIRSASPTDTGRGRWHLPGAIPATTALRILLTASGIQDRHTNKPFSEELLFAICGGVGMGVASFYYAASDFASFYIAGRHLWYDHLTYLKNALERFGIKPIVRESSGVKTSLQQLHEAVADGPCVAWVEGYQVIMVYDVDDKREVALIGDLADEPEEIPLERLVARRAAVKQYKNRLLSLPKAVEKANADPSAIVGDGLAACVSGLKNGKKGAEAMSGLERLKLWRDQIAPSKAKDNWRQMFPPGHRLWTALTAVHDYVENIHTGGGLCRPTFADGLAEAAQLPGLKNLAAVSETYAGLGKAWTDLSEAALPSKLAPFRAARELCARRAELKSQNQSLRPCEMEFERQKDLARREFPLAQKECDELLSVLHEKVSTLYDREAAGRAMLAEALK